MQMRQGDGLDQTRRKYYVSVQAGQILEDQGAAAYELEIMANEREFIRLQELFEELSSMDELQTFHFAKTPFSPASDEEMNYGYDSLIVQIYQLLHEYGTESTKRHIEQMGLPLHEATMGGGAEDESIT